MLGLIIVLGVVSAIASIGMRIKQRSALEARRIELERARPQQSTEHDA